MMHMHGTTEKLQEIVTIFVDVSIDKRTDRGEQDGEEEQPGQSKSHTSQ